MIGGCKSILDLSLMKIMSIIVSFGFTLRFRGVINLSSLSNLELDPAHIMTKATLCNKMHTLSIFKYRFSFLIKLILLVRSELQRINELRQVKF